MVALIVGGGFAGVRCAYDLVHQARRSKLPLDITLVSSSPRHVEYPTMYEIAVTCLSEEPSSVKEHISNSVGVSLSEIFEKLPVQIRQGEVVRIDTTNKKVILQDGSALSYDILVIAAGAQLATYGIPSVRQHAFSVKTLPETLRLRYHIAQQFEIADHRALTFVVAGGGATGIEIASELANHAQYHCARHNIKRDMLHIILVEAKGEILPGINNHLRRKIARRLTEIGVKILSRTTVNQVAPDHALIGDSNERLDTNTVIWTAGLQASDLLKTSGLPLKNWGILTDDTMQVRGQTDIFAAGDSAVLSITDRRRKSPPASVPVAYTQGALVARNVIRQINNQPLESYQYRPLAQIIALGGKHGVVIMPSNWGWVGRSPWIVKRFVSLHYWSHLLPLSRALALALHGLRFYTAND